MSNDSIKRNLSHSSFTLFSPSELEQESLDMHDNKNLTTSTPISDDYYSQPVSPMTPSDQHGSSLLSDTRKINSLSNSFSTKDDKTDTEKRKKVYVKKRCSQLGCEKKARDGVFCAAHGGGRVIVYY
jgi:hypothetical protein